MKTRKTGHMTDASDRRARNGRSAMTRRAKRASPARFPSALLECLLCQSTLVCPTHWGTAGDDSWWILSRCGECEVWAEVVVNNAQAAWYDTELDRQMAAMRHAAQRLDAERMADEARAFVMALHANQVIAADFDG
jgi:hypothetical protein